MKKFFIIGMVFLMGAALAVPAMAADFKMTWTGSFELNGMYISNDVIKNGDDKVKNGFRKLLESAEATANPKKMETLSDDITNGIGRFIGEQRRLYNLTEA